MRFVVSFQQLCHWILDRVWWRKLPENRKISLGQIYRNHRKKVYGAGALTAGGLAVAYESHIQVNKCTASKFLSF